MRFLSYIHVAPLDLAARAGCHGRWWPSVKLCTAGRTKQPRTIYHKEQMPIHSKECLKQHKERCKRYKDDRQCEHQELRHSYKPQQQELYKLDLRYYVNLPTRRGTYHLFIVQNTVMERKDSGIHNSTVHTIFIWWRPEGFDKEL